VSAALGFALELAAPSALWGLTALVPIALFHLYFRRRRRVLVPFAPLLVESLGPVRREARFKRLREAASLAARLLALACTVLALAGLRPAEVEERQPDLFVVIDADCTTAAREADGALRLEHARRLARALVSSVPARDGDGPLAAEVSVLLALEAPRLLVGPTTDRSEALRALEGPLFPAPTDADLGRAVTLALGAAAQRAKARLVVLTARPFERPSAPERIAIGILGVGVTRADQGFEGLVVERVADSGRYDVRVSVANDDATARTRKVIARADGQVVGAADVTLAPGAVEEVRFAVPAPSQPAWLTVSLEGEDAFPANDVVEARLAPAARPSILVVHGGRVRPYTAAVVKALAAEGLVDEARSGFVRAADLAAARARDVILVDGVALPAAALRPGAYVFLAPLAGALPFDLGPEVTQPLIWRTAEGHPLVRDLDFRRAFVVRARTLDGAGLEPLAYAEGRPVIAEGERDGVRYVALGLDPEGSMLPVQAALPLLVRGAIARLARAPVFPLRPCYRRGEALRPDVDLPGGPDADVRWDGWGKDGGLAAAGRGEASVRLAADGLTWRVPPGAVGRTTVTTTAAGAAPWAGYTALVDLDPDRTIAPARPAAALPPPAPPLADTPGRWRRGLIALAVLFLLLDLAVLAHARRVRD